MFNVCACCSLSFKLSMCEDISILIDTIADAPSNVSASWSMRLCKSMTSSRTPRHKRSNNKGNVWANNFKSFFVRFNSHSRTNFKLAVKGPWCTLTFTLCNSFRWVVNVSTTALISSTGQRPDLIFCWSSMTLGKCLFSRVPKERSFSAMESLFFSRAWNSACTVSRLFWHHDIHSGCFSTDTGRTSLSWLDSFVSLDTTTSDNDTVLCS